MDTRKSFPPEADQPWAGTMNHRKSFTLIELLVVLALVAILSVVVVMTLNPAELIKQARDSNRLSDLSTINTALNLFSTDVTSGFTGTSSVVYVSIPSNSSTCAGLGLPGLSVGYAYNCVTAVNLRNTDGTGWIPVNFQRISSNSPISQLPIDPTNTTTSLNYYTYVTGGSFALLASLESQKYLKTSAQSDGGLDPGRVEIGNNLALASQANGLVGYWPFNEGAGLTVKDFSGNINDGTFANGPTWQSSAVCKLDGCLLFNGLDSSVNLMSDPVGIGTTTVVAWMYATGLGGGSYGRIVSNGKFACAVRPGNRTYMISNSSTLVLPGYNNTFALNKWEFVSFTRDTAGRSTLFVNGAATGPYNQNGGVLEVGVHAFMIGNIASSTSGFGGYLDDLRIYNRILSASEILNMYNATR